MCFLNALQEFDLNVPGGLSNGHANPPRPANPVATSANVNSPPPPAVAPPNPTTLVANLRRPESSSNIRKAVGEPSAAASSSQPSSSSHGPSSNGHFRPIKPPTQPEPPKTTETTHNEPKLLTRLDTSIALGTLPLDLKANKAEVAIVMSETNIVKSELVKDETRVDLETAEAPASGLKRKASTSSTNSILRKEPTEPILNGQPQAIQTRRESNRKIKKPKYDLDEFVTSLDDSHPGTPSSKAIQSIPNQYQLKYCNQLLKELFSKRHLEYAWPFYKPVDVKGLGLTDYFDIIEQPMDMGSVRVIDASILNLLSSRSLSLSHFV